MLNKDFDTVFEQLLQAQVSKGVKSLDLDKVATFMSRVLNTEITPDLITAKSENYSVISDITGNKISLGESNEEKQDAEESEDSVHDLAVNQAAKNMFEATVPFKSVSAALERIKVGSVIRPSAVVNIPESFNGYLFHKANQEKRRYVVESVEPYKTESGSLSVMGSMLKCRIEGLPYTFEMPIRSLVK